MANNQFEFLFQLQLEAAKAVEQMSRVITQFQNVAKQGVQVPLEVVPNLGFTKQTDKAIKKVKAQANAVVSQASTKGTGLDGHFERVERAARKATGRVKETGDFISLVTRQMRTSEAAVAGLRNKTASVTEEWKRLAQAVKVAQAAIDKSLPAAGRTSIGLKQATFQRNQVTGRYKGTPETGAGLPFHLEGIQSGARRYQEILKGEATRLKKRQDELEKLLNPTQKGSLHAQLQDAIADAQRKAKSLAHLESKAGSLTTTQLQGIEQEQGRLLEKIKRRDQQIKAFTAATKFVGTEDERVTLLRNVDKLRSRNARDRAVLGNLEERAKVGDSSANKRYDDISAQKLKVDQQLLATDENLQKLALQRDKLAGERLDLAKKVLEKELKIEALKSQINATAKSPEQSNLKRSLAGHQRSYDKLRGQLKGKDEEITQNREYREVEASDQKNLRFQARDLNVEQLRLASGLDPAGHIEARRKSLAAAQNVIKSLENNLRAAGSELVRTKADLTTVNQEWDKFDEKAKLAAADMERIKVLGPAVPALAAKLAEIRELYNTLGNERNLSATGRDAALARLRALGEELDKELHNTTRLQKAIDQLTKMESRHQALAIGNTRGGGLSGLLSGEPAERQNRPGQVTNAYKSMMSASLSWDEARLQTMMAITTEERNQALISEGRAKHALDVSENVFRDRVLGDKQISFNGKLENAAALDASARQTLEQAFGNAFKTVIGENQQKRDGLNAEGKFQAAREILDPTFRQFVDQAFSGNLGVHQAILRTMQGEVMVLGDEKAVMDQVLSSTRAQYETLKKTQPLLQKQIDLEGAQARLQSRDQSRKPLGVARALRGASYVLGGYAVGITAAMKVRDAFSQALQFQSELAGIQGVLRSKSAGERDILGAGIAQVAQKYGGDLIETAKAARVLAQSGLEANEVIKELDSTLLAMRGMDITTESMQELQIALKAVHGESASTLEILEKISRVEAQYAISAQDITDVLKKSTPVVLQFADGISGIEGIEDFTIGFSTVVVEQLRSTGTQVANAMNFMLARLAMPEVLRNLQNNFGLRLAADSRGKSLLPIDELFEEVVRRYRDLREQEPARANELAAALAGGRRVNFLLAALDKYENILEVSKTSADAFGDAHLRAEIKMETMEARLGKLNTNFTLFMKNLIDSTALTHSLGFAVNTLSRVLGGTSGGGAGVLTAVGLLAGGGLAVTGGKKAYRNLQARDLVERERLVGKDLPLASAKELIQNRADKRQYGDDVAASLAFGRASGKPASVGLRGKIGAIGGGILGMVGVNVSLIIAGILTAALAGMIVKGAEIAKAKGIFGKSDRERADERFQRALLDSPQLAAYKDVSKKFGFADIDEAQRVIKQVTENPSQRLQEARASAEKGRRDRVAAALRADLSDRGFGIDEQDDVAARAQVTALIGRAQQLERIAQDKAVQDISQELDVQLQKASKRLNRSGLRRASALNLEGVNSLTTGAVDGKEYQARVAGRSEAVRDRLLRKATSSSLDEVNDFFNEALPPHIAEAFKLNDDVRNGLTRSISSRLAAGVNSSVAEVVNSTLGNFSEEQQDKLVKGIADNMLRDTRKRLNVKPGQATDLSTNPDAFLAGEQTISKLDAILNKAKEEAVAQARREVDPTELQGTLEDLEKNFETFRLALKSANEEMFKFTRDMRASVFQFIGELSRINAERTYDQATGRAFAGPGAEGDAARSLAIDLTTSRDRALLEFAESTAKYQEVRLLEQSLRAMDVTAVEARAQDERKRQASEGGVEQPETPSMLEDLSNRALALFSENEVNRDAVAELFKTQINGMQNLLPQFETPGPTATEDEKKSIAERNGVARDLRRIADEAFGSFLRGDYAGQASSISQFIAALRDFDNKRQDAQGAIEREVKLAEGQVRSAERRATLEELISQETSDTYNQTLRLEASRQAIVNAEAQVLATQRKYGEEARRQADLAIDMLYLDAERDRHQARYETALKAQNELIQAIRSNLKESASAVVGLVLAFDQIDAQEAFAGATGEGFDGIRGRMEALKTSIIDIETRTARLQESLLGLKIDGKEIKDMATFRRLVDEIPEGAANKKYMQEQLDGLDTRFQTLLSKGAELASILPDSDAGNFFRERFGAILGGADINDLDAASDLMVELFNQFNRFVISRERAARFAELEVRTNERGLAVLQAQQTTNRDVLGASVLMEAARRRILEAEKERVQLEGEASAKAQRDIDLEKQILQIEYERNRLHEAELGMWESRNELIIQGRDNIQGMLSGFEAAASDLSIWDAVFNPEEGRSKAQAAGDVLRSVLDPIGGTLRSRASGGIFSSISESLSKRPAFQALAESPEILAQRKIAETTSIYYSTALTEGSLAGSQMIRTAGQDVSVLFESSIVSGGREVAGMLRQVFVEAGVGAAVLSSVAQKGVPMVDIGEVSMVGDGYGGSQKLPGTSGFGLINSASRSAESFVAQRAQEQAAAKAKEVAAVQKKLARNMSIAILGGQVGGTLIGKGKPGAQTGSSIGSVVGGLAGTELLGFLGTAMAGPVGALAGGLLGGLIGGMFGGDEKKSYQITVLEAIERNSKETVTAIDAQTDALLRPQNRLLNLPSTFNFPTQGPGFASAGSQQPQQTIIREGDVNVTVDARGSIDPDAVEAAAKSGVAAGLAEGRRSRSRVQIRNG